MSVMFTPSMFHVFCELSAPFALYTDCWPDWLPPTLMRSTCTAGACCSTVHGSREVGIFSISTLVTLMPEPALRTSSSGASAVTVIDSDTDGLSVIETSALCATRTLMPARVDVPYPANSALRVYEPGERLRNRKFPCASDTVDCGAPTPLSVTVTPGRTLPSFA